VAAVVGACVQGWYSGAAVQVLALVGSGAGLLVGVALAPVIARRSDDRTLRVLQTLLVLFGATLVVGGAGRAVGERLAQGLRWAGLGRVDTVVGRVLAGGAALYVCWLGANTLANAQSRSLARAVQQSAILRSLDDLLPPAPALFARIDGLVAQQGLPPVFAQFEPDPAIDQPLPPASMVQATAARVAAATVKVSGDGCGGTLTGSGFVVAADLVVTTAPVVAGIRAPSVTDRDGRHPATTVVFDADLDVAVLRATGLAADPLPLASVAAKPGAGAVVLGYPNGGPLDIEAAAVLAQYDAVGRDIYNRDLVTRQIYQLRSLIRPGNSGGPLVNEAGEVIGVVFSRSAVHDDVGYAITTTEFKPTVAEAGQARTPVSTGACAAD
jgi:S1-C subfamily serine protease